MTEVEQLQFHVAKTAIQQLQRQLNNVVEAHKESEERRRRLGEAIDAHNTVQAGAGGLGYHIWEPEGDNHLKTLSCPVVIPAEWLRNLTVQARLLGRREGARAVGAALEAITADENGKIARRTILECDCPGCLRKQRLAREALEGGAES